MPKCPCGCGRELSIEELMGAGHDMLGGFSDVFADLFGGEQRSRRKNVGASSLGVEILKQRLSKASDEEEREEILKGTPKEVLNALGVKRRTFRKIPDHILADAEVVGAKAQIDHLSKTVKSFFISSEESIGVIKKLKKGRKKDQSQIQKLEEVLEDLKGRMSDTQTDLKRSQGLVKSLQEGIENLRKIVAAKDEEIKALAIVAILARNLRAVIDGINVNVSKPELQETINALKLAVADIPPAGGGNGADAEASAEGFISGKASVDSQDQIRAEEFFAAGGGCK